MSCCALGNRWADVGVAAAHGRARRPARQRGMATVELAVGMLTACLLAGMLGWTVSLVALQTRCFDAAGQIARQLARGDQEAAQEAEQRIPDGAELSITKTDAEITVTVEVEASWGALGPVPIAGRASSPNNGR